MALFNISTTGLLLWVVAFFVIYWLWSITRRPFTKYNIPPYAVKPWPIFGHFFMTLGDLRDKMKTWRRLRGDIYSIDLAGQLHILLNDFKDIKEIMIKRADYIVNTQPSFGDELVNEANTGITGARDDNWKEQRTTSLAILRSFGMGKNLMAERINMEATALLDKLVSFNGQPTDVRLLFSVVVSNVISAVASGKRYDLDDLHLDKLVDQSHTFIKYFGHMMMLSSFKPVIRVPGDLFHAKKWVKASLQINEEYTKPFIRKHQENFNENEEPNDFIAAYLREMKKMKDKGLKTHLNEKNLVSIVKILFTAGTDTTATTMMWFVLFLLHNPEIQEKLYNEIETNVGITRFPDVADKSKLTYLNAVIMETQRMASLTPSALRREVNETFEHRGYTFPKGCIIWPVLDSVLHDKKIWGDPEIFRPERFIDKNGSLINREEMIPFNIGRRVCLGESLARMELFLFTSSMVQRFRFELADSSGELPSLDYVFGTVVVPKPFKMRFIDRRLK